MAEELEVGKAELIKLQNQIAKERGEVDKAAQEYRQLRRGLGI
jgi:hypothetical protein